MGVGETEIRFNFITRNIPLRHSCKQPDLFSASQGTRSLVANVAANQSIRESKSIRILHDMITIADYAENGIVAVTHICLEIRDNIPANGQNVFAANSPVKTRKAKCIRTVGSFLNADSQTVPRLFPHIHHSFY